MLHCKPLGSLESHFGYQIFFYILLFWTVYKQEVWSVKRGMTHNKDRQAKVNEWMILKAIKHLLISLFAKRTSLSSFVSELNSSSLQLLHNNKTEKSWKESCFHNSSGKFGATTERFRFVSSLSTNQEKKIQSACLNRNLQTKTVKISENLLQVKSHLYRNMYCSL